MGRRGAKDASAAHRKDIDGKQMRGIASRGKARRREQRRAAGKGQGGQGEGSACTRRQRVQRRGAERNATRPLTARMVSGSSLKRAAPRTTTPGSAASPLLRRGKGGCDAAGQGRRRRGKPTRVKRCGQQAPQGRPRGVALCRGSALPASLAPRQSATPLLNPTAKATPAHRHGAARHSQLRRRATPVPA